MAANDALATWANANLERMAKEANDPGVQIMANPITDRLKQILGGNQQQQPPPPLQQQPPPPQQQPPQQMPTALPPPGSTPYQGPLTGSNIQQPATATGPAQNTNFGIPQATNLPDYSQLAPQSAPNYGPASGSPFGNLDSIFHPQNFLMDSWQLSADQSSANTAQKGLTQQVSNATVPGMPGAPGLPYNLVQYAAGDNAKLANMQEGFLQLAQAWSTGNDIVMKDRIEELLTLGVPSMEVNQYLGQLLNQGPYGTTDPLVRNTSGPVVSPLALTNTNAFIPEHFNRASMDEGQARAAMLQDTAVQRAEDLVRRGQQQQFLLGQMGEVSDDPIRKALQSSHLSTLQDPSSITNADKERIFAAMADQAAASEQAQLRSLASGLGASGIEGSGIGAGLGARIAAERQKSLLGGRRDVEIQQAMQRAQDRLAAQQAAQSFFMGNQGLSSQLAGSIANIGVGGGVSPSIGQINPGLSAEVAASNYQDPLGGFGPVIGGIGQLLGAII
jgi:hypothetical protein